MKTDKLAKAIKRLPIPSKYPISVVSGVAAILIFWGFTIISLTYFPGGYNPFVNWMSDLGSSKLNPRGAIFFNVGCIISGIILFPFFIGLYEWYIGGRKNKRLTILTQLSGFYCAFAMIMIGIFHEDDFLIIHIIWAVSLFTVSVLTFIFPSVALYKYKFTRNVAKFGFFGNCVSFLAKSYISYSTYRLLITAQCL